MNKPSPIDPLSMTSPRQKGGAAGSSASNQIGAGALAPSSPTGEAGAPNLSSLPIGAAPPSALPRAERAEQSTGGATAPIAPTPNDGYGKQPRCETCKRGFYGCLCGPWPEDDDMMPAADVVRIMGDYFPDSGWGLAERSALGMGK